MQNNQDQAVSTQPYKGARDFYPEDMHIQNYIFDTWKKVCKRYGFLQYDGPFIESFELYASKTSEEIVNEQLYSFEDRGKRKVAIRPEMTPTVSRMVAAKLNELPQPIKWFSMPNLWRYEKPQRGRLREHYQLNADMFGPSTPQADFEIIALLVDIMKGFGAKEKMFEVRIGNRKLLESICKNLGLQTEQIRQTIRTIDKKSKVSKEDFEEMLKDNAGLDKNQIVSILQFLNSPEKTLKESEDRTEGAREVLLVLELAKNANMQGYVKYDPTVVRGFDYYTDTVFELFDLNPQNTRALAGGGRYNDLLQLFNKEKLPAIGFGMGDVTLKNFLEVWNLLPKQQNDTEYLVTIWPSENIEYTYKAQQLTQKLREKDKNTLLWLETTTKLEKQLKYADKNNIKYVIIVGENELKEGNITIKDLQTKKQETVNEKTFFEKL